MEQSNTEKSKTSSFDQKRISGAKSGHFAFFSAISMKSVPVGSDPEERDLELKKAISI